MTYTPPEQYATEKQLSFINALCEQRQLTEEVKAHVEGQVVSGTMTKAEASKRIEWLLAQSKLPKPVTVYAEVPEGMHKTDGKIWKVYRTRNGHQVAAELIGMMGDEGEVWGFEYRGKSGLKGLSEATRMNEEDAKAFGKTYGICVRCAAQLTDERSIFAGYGPVCAKHQGWYYPSMDEAMEGLGITPESISTALIEGKKPIEVTKEEIFTKIGVADADTPDSPWHGITAIEFVPEQPDDFDEVAEEGKDPFDAFLPDFKAEFIRTPGPNPDDLKDAAKALEDFAAVLKEHAILPESASLAAAEIAERMDRVCDQPGCSDKVFTDDEIARDVHLTINPDYCTIHDYDGMRAPFGSEPGPLTEGPLRMELLPEDLS